MFVFAGEEYKSEEDYLDSLKQDEHYHYSVPFEYIELKRGDGDYIVAEATMEVDVDWNAAEHGYSITYCCPDMYKIDPKQGNSDEREFYECQVEERVLNELDAIGIGSTALVSGTGTF